MTLKTLGGVQAVGIVAFLCSVLIFLNSEHLSSDCGMSPKPSSSYRYAMMRGRSPKEVSTKLAFDQSYGFFDDIDDKIWVDFYQKRAREADHNFLDDPLQDWNPKSAAWFHIHNYEPVFTCPYVRRIGGLGYNSKWVCDPHRLIRIARERKQRNQGTCLVYSVGCHGEIEFELGLMQEIGQDTCEIHVFDPDDYSDSFKDYPNVFYHTWGLKGSHDPSYVPRVEGDFKSLAETIKELGHEDRTIDIFKIDCEGCEYSVFRDFFKWDIRQIQIESHKLPRKESGMTPVDYFGSFEKNGYALFYREPNIYPDAPNGNFMEWAYIKLKPEFWSSDN